jgi:hypothetical protein
MGDVPMDERTKDEVLATYTGYLDAFRANDISALDKLIQYPLAYIGNGRTTFVETLSSPARRVDGRKAVA